MNLTPLPAPLPAYPNTRQRLDYLCQAVAYLVTDSAAIHLMLENLTAMSETFQSDLDAETAADTALTAAVAAEIAKLDALLAGMSANVAPTQAQLDQLRASTQAIGAATPALTADDPATPPAST